MAPRGDVWVAPEVRVLTGWGEPLFVVDGGTWLWREGRWLRWEGQGWSSLVAPPLALEALQRDP